MAGIYIYCDHTVRKNLQSSLILTHMFSRMENINIKNDDWLIKENLDDAKRILIKETNNSTMNSWCRDGIPPEYVKDVVQNDSNLILIIVDSKETIRGIALLEVNETEMLLHILCSNETPNVKTRGKMNYGSGGMLLKLIKFLGKDLINGIKLYALETVITLYYKFGWRFITHCDGVERGHISDAVKELRSYYKENEHRLGDIETKELTELLLPFRGKAKDRASYIRTGKKIKERATKEAREDGYEMRLCKETNIYSKFFDDILQDSTIDESKVKAEGKRKGTRRKGTRRKGTRRKGARRKGVRRKGTRRKKHQRRNRN